MSSDSSAQVSLLLPGGMKERSMRSDIWGAMAWNLVFPRVFEVVLAQRGEVYAPRHWPRLVPAHRAVVKPAFMPQPLGVAYLVYTWLAEVEQHLRKFIYIVAAWC